MGLGFTFTLVVMSTIREILGSGTLLSGTPFAIDFTFGVLKPAMILIMPVGGFLTLGFILAAMQKIMSRKNKTKRIKRGVSLMSITSLLSIALGAILVENLSLCRFLGFVRSSAFPKKTDTACMGMASFSS